MTRYNLSTITDFFTDDVTLKTLLIKVQNMDILDNLVKKKLTVDLATHCRVASYETGILTLITDTNVWATQLRFSTASLLSTLRKHRQWIGLTRINIKVDPTILQPTSPTKPPPTEKPTLPKSVAQQLITIAENLPQKPDSERLRDALKKLAQHGE